MLSLSVGVEQANILAASGCAFHSVVVQTYFESGMPLIRFVVRRIFAEILFHQPIEVKDVESIDPEYYRNLGVRSAYLAAIFLGA